MKKIEAIIRPEKLGAVRAAIAEVGYTGITISDVRGHGNQKGLKQQYRGVSYVVDILPKVKIEMVATDALVEQILKAVTEAAYTGAIGDGKIFVSTIDDVIRVRTGERGDRAL